MMTAETDPMAALRARALELEAQAVNLFAAMRATVNQAEEEVRETRARAERFNLEVFTEQEAAARLGVSADTLAGLREKLKLPHLRVGVQIRYTNQHLFEITEKLERNGEQKQGPRPVQRRAI